MVYINYFTISLKFPNKYVPKGTYQPYFHFRKKSNKATCRKHMMSITFTGFYLMPLKFKFKHPDDENTYNVRDGYWNCHPHSVG